MRCSDWSSDVCSSDLVALVVGGVPDGMRLGIAFGALSALFVALFGSLNKRLVERADPLTMTALELGAGALALTALAPLMPMRFPVFAGDLLAPIGRASCRERVCQYVWI